MSTEICLPRKVRSINLISFYGGSERGNCMQVTQVDGGSFVTMTYDEARSLARAILRQTNPRKAKN